MLHLLQRNLIAQYPLSLHYKYIPFCIERFGFNFTLNPIPAPGDSASFECNQDMCVGWMQLYSVPGYWQLECSCSNVCNW